MLYETSKMAIDVKKIKIKDLCFLHFVLFLYAIAMLLSKTASSHEFLSLEFIFFYGFMFIILGVYALLWQQVLKKTSLNLAIINKAITIIWGVVFGVVLFKENISFSMIIGMMFILVGLIIMVLKNE